MASTSLNLLAAVCICNSGAFLASYFFVWWQVLLVWNAALGLCMFNIMWATVARYVDVNEERE
jgi:hypothetical protein